MNKLTQSHIAFATAKHFGYTLLTLIEEAIKELESNEKLYYFASEAVFATACYYVESSDFDDDYRQSAKRAMELLEALDEKGLVPESFRQRFNDVSRTLKLLVH